MMMIKTNYTIEKQGVTYSALKNGGLEAQGLNDKESALKAIHVLEGSSMNEFYEELNNNVYLKRKLEKDLE